MTQKPDLRERCFYLLTLFKAKDMTLFEKYTTQLAKTSAEDSTEFYHFLMGEYKKLLEGPTFSQPQRPAVKVEPPKPVITKKEIPKKKAVKKPTVKKKPAVKKVAAKKKTAKKTTKKPVQKITKNVAKKKVKKQ